MNHSAFDLAPFEQVMPIAHSSMVMKRRLKRQLRLHTEWVNTGSRGVRLQQSFAYLSDADLSGANLQEAGLRYAYLRNANLSGANLSGADLTGANLQGANLQGANLTRINLENAYLSGANLQDAVGLPITEDAPQRLQAVAAAILGSNGAGLAMEVWHASQASRCLAGWAIHQAGPIGETMEAIHGSYIAGLLLLGHEAASHFYDTNEAAIEWLRSVAEKVDQPLLLTPPTNPKPLR